LDTPDVASLLDRVPGWEGRAHVVGALGGGITNRNLLIEVRRERGDAERFVLRLPGRSTDLLEIRRDVEFEAASRAASLGIAPPVAAFLQPEGCLVTKFVDGTALTPETLATPARLADITAMLHEFHASGPLAADFDAFRVPHLHREAAESRGIAVPAGFSLAATAAETIQKAFDVSPEPRAPCHNDLLNANFLTDAADPARVWLLDWEYAGNNDRYFDLGNLAVNNGLDEAAREALVHCYFGSVTNRRSARLDLMMIMSDFREAMWGVVQQGISTLEFDYAAYSQQHFDRLLRAVSRADFAARLDAAADGSIDHVRQRPT
jgi:thiamine kinase-like enzyme